MQCVCSHIFKSAVCFSHFPLITHKHLPPTFVLCLTFPVQQNMSGLLCCLLLAAIVSAAAAASVGDCTVQQMIEEVKFEFQSKFEGIQSELQSVKVNWQEKKGLL